MNDKANEPWALWAEQMQRWMATPGASQPFGASPTSPASGASGSPSAAHPFFNPLGQAFGGTFPNPFASPFAAFTGAPLDAQSIMKAIDPAEIDKRIADMRAVEAWLKFSLSALEMSIKTMEMQRDAYASFKSVQQSASEAGERVAAYAKESVREARRSAAKPRARAKK